MDADRLVALIRSLSETPSRRGALRLLAGSGLGGLLALGRDSSKAKKGKKRKKKRGDRTCPPSTGGGTVSSPPPDFDATCLGPGNSFVTGSGRFGQTFAALQSGKLSRAQLVLLGNSDGADFVMDIRTVDGLGVPTGTVLATTTINNVPATPSGNQRTITADFATPATVVTGQTYALAITSVGGGIFTVEYHTNNACAGGSLFADPFANNTFGSLGAVDLVYATFVRG